MTGFTFDFNTFSDLYKDANGVRPRGHRFYSADTTDAERQEIWDYTVEALNAEMEHQEACEVQAVKDFTSLINKTIELGAPDRGAAIRWIADSFNDDDPGYICYLLGIPYSFEGEIQSALSS